MNSFKAWIGKEFKEGVRRYAFLGMGGAFLFFAILDPLMMRFLPAILASQMGSASSSLPPGALVPASLFPATRSFGFETFLGDIFEIGTLVVCLVLGGVLARERRSRALVIPFSKGSSISGMVLAKAAANTAFVAPAAFIAVMLSYAYAGAVFPGSPFEAGVPLVAGAAQGLYFAYLACLVLFSSAIMPTPLAASLLALALAYGVPPLASLFKIGRFFPSYLALGAQKTGDLVAKFAEGDFLPAAVSAAACIVLCLAGAIGAMRRAEL
jgi:ABC-2 type transport system permease protein